ncbi:multidrug resistance efflux pump [Bradyrhizobium sp. LB7.1]
MARERGQRLVAAQAAVAAALEAHERALDSVPAAEANLNTARAKLDEVEREVAAAMPAA